MDKPYSCDFVDVKDYRRAYARYSKFTNREKILARLRERRREGNDKEKARLRRYKNKKLNNTPPWLSYVQCQEIEAFYKEARWLTSETGILHHVDHIWPLNGRSSCGLHVPWNLQILLQRDNDCKNNREPQDG